MSEGYIAAVTDALLRGDDDIAVLLDLLGREDNKVDGQVHVDVGVLGNRRADVDALGGWGGGVELSLRLEAFSLSIPHNVFPYPQSVSHSTESRPRDKRLFVRHGTNEAVGIEVAGLEVSKRLWIRR